MHVADRLQEAMDRNRSIACVGLDPRPELIPPALSRAMTDRYGDTEQAVAAAFLAFNEGIIEAVAGHCAAVKPQTACYEAYGPAGWEALRTTIRAARSAGVPVVVDGKRGDIGSTATHYRQAFFGGAPTLGGRALPSTRCDWLTVNGYLGSDGVFPVLGAPGAHGVFVLVRTSNPSGGEIQAAACTGDGKGGGCSSPAERMARLVQRWGADRRGAFGLSDVGAVVGATHPEHARALRRSCPIRSSSCRATAHRGPPVSMRWPAHGKTVVAC